MWAVLEYGILMQLHLPSWNSMTKGTCHRNIGISNHPLKRITLALDHNMAERSNTKSIDQYRPDFEQIGYKSFRLLATLKAKITWREWLPIEQHTNAVPPLPQLQPIWWVLGTAGVLGNLISKLPRGFFHCLCDYGHKKRLLTIHLWDTASVTVMYCFVSHVCACVSGMRTRYSS